MTTVSIGEQDEVQLSARISQVILYVENQSKSLEFYTKKIGFEKKIDFPTTYGGRWIAVGPKGQDIGIALQGYESDIGKKSGAASMVIEVEDCRKTYQELKSRGVEFKRNVGGDVGEELRELPYGIVAFFTDPDGYIFELMQPSKALAASQRNAMQKTESTKKGAKEIVTSFIESLNNKDLKSARSYVSEDFTMTGPGTSFESAEAYFEAAEKANQTYQSGKYDIKKIFMDGTDVCVVNDVIWGSTTFPAVGFYHVEDHRIHSLRLIYDPGQANAARQDYVRSK